MSEHQPGCGGHPIENLMVAEDAPILVRDSTSHMLRCMGIDPADVAEALDVRAAFTLGIYPCDLQAALSS